MSVAPISTASRIEVLPVPVNVKIHLRGAGITTLGELQRHSEPTLRSKGLPGRRIRRILDAMREVGLPLQGDQQPTNAQLMTQITAAKRELAKLRRFAAGRGILFADEELREVPLFVPELELTAHELYLLAQIGADTVFDIVTRNRSVVYEALKTASNPSRATAMIEKLGKQLRSEYGLSFGLLPAPLPIN